MTPGWMKFIPFQTFAKVVPQNWEYTHTKILGCGICNYDQFWWVFEGRGGITGVLEKRGSAQV